MRNGLILTIAALAVIAFATNSFAAKVYKSMGVIHTEIEGTVEKIIPHQGALIIKDKEDGEKTHVHIDKSTLAALEVGDTIKVRMQGSNCMVERVTVK
ncbi:MAG: hypothetical protein H6756_02475 [Candidatus Omnitrophica bacterium]|nr:hypothetical protein [Candidatus Omnitrophota bacterium]